MKKNIGKVITFVVGGEYTLKENNVFVTMTDKYLSGWGCATDKIAKRVMVCENEEQARLIANRVRNNPKCLMKNVNILYELPYYNPNRYTISYDKFSENMYNY